MELQLSERLAGLKAVLDAKPGATPVPYQPSRAKTPWSLMYKVQNKVFAIVNLRGTEYVVLKCDPFLAQILREQYAGVGHRTHVDRRFWISIDLDSDVPFEETAKAVDHSYEQVCAGLTRKQKAELAALSNG